ncbi:flagellar biosynthesis chaperone [Legionella massiliensis]|uniref:Flagellar FliJ protein n=1 Tax=Legionella massiliensis TaxID=1034943 RepID=A0A078L0B9_9GAMM|nr:flagellar export protein FliJ [Legionella massiliensis]CDZ78606.1 flagellar biosynthesis chaperone [Legionella massiliensis]CEE14344.1 flagellar biosynthesis chaperone [Legionella massiliensis]
MKGRINRLQQLLTLKEQSTRAAAQDLAQAREQFTAGKAHHNQLLGYRQDYLQQLNQIGDAGCTVGDVRNRINFIGQLDHALSHLNQQLGQLAKQRAHYESLYLRAKSEQDVVQRLLERVEKQENIRKERIEQKESDEYAQKQWYSKKSVNNVTKSE